MNMRIIINMPLWAFILLTYATVVMAITVPQLKVSQQIQQHSGQTTMNVMKHQQHQQHQQQQQQTQQQQQQHHIHEAAQPQVAVHSNVLTDVMATAITTATGATKADGDGGGIGNGGSGAPLAKTTAHHNYPHFAAMAQATTAQAHLRPKAEFIHDNNKDDVLSEMYKQQQQQQQQQSQQQQQQFNTEDDLNDLYQIYNELNRDNYIINDNGVNVQPTRHHEASHSHASYSPQPTLPFFTKNLYGQLNHHNLMMPSSPTLNSIYSQMLPPYASIMPASAITAPSPVLPITPRFLPMMINYAQPMYFTYPFYMPADIMDGNADNIATSNYPNYPNNPDQYEDTMPRAKQDTRENSGNRRLNTPHAYNQQNSPNSPIFYVRVSPTAAPYIVFPDLNMIPYHSSIISPFSTFSSVFNVPMNFLANGKPMNIHQLGGSPNDVQAHLQYPNYHTLSQIREHANIPINQLFDQQHYNAVPPHGHFTSSPSSSPSSPLMQNYFNPFAGSSKNVAYLNNRGFQSSLHDSKLTNLKRPYFFNGRPEDIYVLQNNMKSSYMSDNNNY